MKKGPSIPVLDESKVVHIQSYPKAGDGKRINGNRTDFDAEILKQCQRANHGDEGRFGGHAEKIIVVGDHSVGKTCLVRRYCENQFTEGYKATIGVDFIYKQYNILGNEFTLHIWDTAGQEQFKCISKAYFRGASAVLLCFDLGNPYTLGNLTKWYDDVKMETSDDLMCFVVGLKSDMFHVVTKEEGETASHQMNAEYWETSAKEGNNVSELFARVAALLFEKSARASMTHSDNSSHTTQISSHVFTLDPTSANNTNTSTSTTQKKCCL